MKNPLLHAFIIILALASSGCAFNPQSVAFSRTLAVPMADIGTGKAVSLTVKDERAETGLGRRGTGMAPAAAITTKEDMVEVVRDKFAVGLQNLGFTVNSNPNADRRIVVELRLLEYGTSTGFWTGGVHTKGAVKILARFEGAEFEKTIRAEEEERIMVVPTADHNAELINKILDQTLIKVFADEEFRAFLKR